MRTREQSVSRESGDQRRDLRCPRQLRHRSSALFGAVACELTVGVEALEQRDNLVDVTLAPTIHPRVVLRRMLHRALTAERKAAASGRQVEVTSIRRYDRWNAGGHTLHRHEIRSALATIREERNISLAYDRAHECVRREADIDRRLTRNAVRHKPFANLQRTIGHTRNAAHMPCELDVRDQLRPVVLPRRDEQRLGMARDELTERRNDNILTLPVFKLSAREHHEAIAEHAGTRGGVEDARINALNHRPDIR